MKKEILSVNIGRGKRLESELILQKVIAVGKLLKISANHT